MFSSDARSQSLCAFTVLVYVVHSSLTVHSSTLPYYRCEMKCVLEKANTIVISLSICENAASLPLTTVYTNRVLTLQEYIKATLLSPSPFSCDNRPPSSTSSRQ